ncbi:MAG: class I SAM-dependent methyltransferase [Acidimicrobiia bacterium]
MDRRTAIDVALRRAGPGSSYLEIGLGTGETFRRVRARRKVGVDPRMPDRAMVGLARSTPQRARRPGRSHELVYRTTSDRFFRSHQARLRRHPLDVVLVDGLHTHDQTRRDIENAVHALAPRGVVIAHDCNPQSADDAAPAPVALRWNGECWKAIVTLRATRPDLSVCVLDCDEGLGLVRRRSVHRPPPLDLTPAAIEAMTYDDLAADRVRLLDLRPPEFFRAWLDGADGPGSDVETSVGRTARAPSS